MIRVPPKTQTSKSELPPSLGIRRSVNPATRYPYCKVAGDVVCSLTLISQTAHTTRRLPLWMSLGIAGVLIGTAYNNANQAKSDWQDWGKCRMTFPTGDTINTCAGENAFCMERTTVNADGEDVTVSRHLD